LVNDADVSAASRRSNRSHGVVAWIVERVKEAGLRNGTTTVNGTVSSDCAQWLLTSKYITGATLFEVVADWLDFFNPEIANSVFMDSHTFIRCLMILAWLTGYPSAFKRRQSIQYHIVLLYNSTQTPGSILK